MMKKITIVFGALIACLLLAIIIIPLVVDVDKYRPQIVQVANEHLNGKLNLGKLSLSLWGAVKIEVAGLELTDAAGNKVVSVNDAYFHLPYTSLLGGSPELTFRMQKPDVNVIKNKAGQLNVMSLMKPSPAAPGTPPTGGAQPPAGAPPTTTAGGPTQLPAIVTHARLGIELTNALLNYHDATTGLDTKIQDLNFRAKDISLTRTMSLELWANLDTKMGKTFQLRGPARLSAQVTPHLVENRFAGAKLDAKADMDGLEIAAPGTFEKKAGIAANAALSVDSTDQEVEIKHAIARFFNVEIDASGSITHLTTGPVVGLEVKSNAIELKPWVELVPVLATYELGGSASFNMKASGPSEKLIYNGSFKVDGLTAKAPNIKGQPRIDLVANFSTDRLDHLGMTLKGPGSDLQINGSVISFTKPHADFQVTSSGLDLDQLIEFPPPGAKPEAGKPAAQASAPVATKAGPSDFDALLEPIRENKMLQATSANLGVNIKLLKARGVRITDLVSKLYFHDLTAGIQSFAMKLWSGAISASAALQMKPKTPTYQFAAKVTGMDLAQAVESQLQLFKNTLLGKASFEINGGGESLNPTPATANLKAKGRMRVDNATFATIDVGKMVADALNKSIGQIAQKVPTIQGKTVSLPAGSSKYEYISSDFTIAGGKFSAPNFVAKSMPNQGIDLQGSTTVSLIDKSLNTTWTVIDTYNYTHAKDLSVNLAGTQVNHILAEGNGPVKFPVHAGCTIMAPCYSYTEVPEYLTKVAVNNVSGAATGRAKAELQNQAKSLIKQAPPQLQDQLNNLGSKLFH